MACDCIEKITEKMAEHLKKQNPDYTILESNFQKKGYSFKSGQSHSYNEVKVVYTFQKKDGSTSSRKTEIMDAYGSYCQFCGKLHDEGKEEAENGL